MSSEYKESLGQFIADMELHIKELKSERIQHTNSIEHHAQMLDITRQRRNIIELQLITATRRLAKAQKSLTQLKQ